MKKKLSNDFILFLFSVSSKHFFMFYKALFQVSTSALQFKKNNKHCSQYIWVNLTTCEVKMAGYWPNSFLRVYGLRWRKERGQNPAMLTEQAWSIKDLLYGFQRFFLRDTAGSPKRAR